MPANEASSPRFSRRRLLHAAVASAVGVPSLAAAKEGAKEGVFTEPARDVPLINEADVIVCGAGPAGVTAAITAARAGAKVRLFEWRGCLGGVWTAGLLGYLLFNEQPRPIFYAAAALIATGVLIVLFTRHPRPA